PPPRAVARSRAFPRAPGRTHPPSPDPGEPGSWEAVEPVGREARPGEDEDQRRAGEELGHFLLLLGVADLRAEVLVDLGEVVRRRRLEEATAGRLRDSGGVWGWGGAD